MSKIAISGASTGTATFTIESPATSTNRTLTLPDNTGTILTNATTAGFPAGSVLQVVSQNFTSNFEISTNTFTDSGVTVTITPTSATSKILVLITLGGVYKDGSDSLTGIKARLLRGSTTLQQFANRLLFNSVSGQPNNITVAFNYLDSPATTSATTYKVQVANQQNVAKVAININGPDDASSITVMEIAA